MPIGPLQETLGISDSNISHEKHPYEMSLACKCTAQQDRNVLCYVTIVHNLCPWLMGIYTIHMYRCSLALV